MSLEFEQQITLDLTVQKVQNVHCSEDDKNSRNIVIQLTDKGKPYNVSDEKLYFKLTKPDGNYVYIDEDDTEHLYKENGKIVIILSDQATAVGGICKAEIQLKKDGKIITTVNFHVIVKKSVLSDDSIVSDIESNVLDKLITHLDNDSIHVAPDERTLWNTVSNKAEKDHTHTTVNGHTVESDVPVNAKFTDTWRGIQDNLTSESASDSLSANQGRILNNKLTELDNSKLKGYTVSYTVPANTGGWHKIAQITGGHFNFDLYVTGNWMHQRKSNAHFQIQNTNGSVRIVQLSGLFDPSGIRMIRMVRVVDDRNTWILEENSTPTSRAEIFSFTIAGDVTIIPLDGSVDTSTDFKDSVSLNVSDVPTGAVITTSNIDNALSPESVNPVQNKVVKAEFDKLNSNLSDLGKCKNLLKSILQTTTLNGVTCIYNGDGTYTLNGTATVKTFFNFILNYNFKKDTKIIGCPPNGSANSFGIFIYNVAGGFDYGNGFTFKEDVTTRAGIYINSGYTCNNLVFKPMITTNLNVTYDDFVPYTGDGDTLTADVAKINSDLSSKTNTSYYCTCDTAINTAKKVVTCSDLSFSLKLGTEINVLFTYGNSGTNPTLNVNNTGDKLILPSGNLSGLYLSPKFVYKFIYDGTYWRFIDEINGSVVSNGDFNNMTNPGFYTMRSASGNKPNSGGSYYGLLVLKSDNGNYVEQIAFKENSYELYIRALSGSTWKAWERVTTASSLSSEITSVLKDNGYDKNILFDGLMGSTTTLYGLTKHTTTDSVFSFYVILRIVGFGNENNKYSGGFVKELCIYYRTDASWGGTVACTVNIEDDHNSGNYIKLTVDPNVCASSSGDVPRLNLDFTHASTMRIFKIESL